MDQLWTAALAGGGFALIVGGIVLTALWANKREVRVAQRDNKELGFSILDWDLNAMARWCYTSKIDPVEAAKVLGLDEQQRAELFDILESMPQSDDFSER